MADMTTVICRDGWVFAGVMSREVAGELVFDAAECLSKGAGKWSPPDGSRLIVPCAAIVALVA